MGIINYFIVSYINMKIITLVMTEKVNKTKNTLLQYQKKLQNTRKWSGWYSSVY